MVDYPTNRAGPVLAFAPPVSPEQAQRALQEVSKALDDLWNPKPRKQRLGPRQLSRGRLRDPRSMLLGLITSWAQEFYVDNLMPLGLGAEELLSNGWTLVADNCELQKSCCVGCNGTVNKANRYTSLAQYNHNCCARTPQGNELVPGATVSNQAVSVDIGRRQGPLNYVAWQYWFERPANQGTALVPNWGTPLRWGSQPRLRAAAKQTGGGKVRTRDPGLTTKRARPKRGEKEAPKQRWGAGAFPFRWLLEGAFEGLDVLEALHDALPRHLRCNGAIGSAVHTGACMLDALLNNLDSVDWSEALENLVDNEIEDRFFGTFGNMTKREAQINGRPRGLQVKPSLKYGGWTPCLFCN